MLPHNFGGHVTASGTEHAYNVNGGFSHDIGHSGVSVGANVGVNGQFGHGHHDVNGSLNITWKPQCFSMQPSAAHNIAVGEPHSGHFPQLSFGHDASLSHGHSNAPLSFGHDAPLSLNHSNPSFSINHGDASLSLNHSNAPLSLDHSSHTHGHDHDQKTSIDDALNRLQHDPTSIPWVHNPFTDNSGHHQSQFGPSMHVRIYDDCFRPPPIAHPHQPQSYPQPHYIPRLGEHNGHIIY